MFSISLRFSWAPGNGKQGRAWVCGSVPAPASLGSLGVLSGVWQKPAIGRRELSQRSGEALARENIASQPWYQARLGTSRRLYGLFFNITCNSRYYSSLVGYLRILQMISNSLILSELKQRIWIITTNEFWVTWNQEVTAFPTSSVPFTISTLVEEGYVLKLTDFYETKCL